MHGCSVGTYPECQLEALPFLCQYYFPLTDCLNNKIYSATQEECERISTTVCAIPWKLAISFGEELPECDSLAQTCMINKKKLMCWLKRL